MLRVMDNTELTIEQIKSLRMVHFYHIIKEDKYIEAVLAYYDRDKVINLCTLDKYYEKLLDKLLNLYESEKDDNWIIADDYSKKILDGIIQFDVRQYESLTDGYSQVKEAAFEHKGYMSSFIVPIMRFIINQLYTMTEQELLWNPIGRDWFGTGEISAHCNGKKVMFPYRITMINEGSYSVEIGNVLKTGNKLLLSICFGKDGVEIAFGGSTYSVEGSIKYLFAKDNLVCIADVLIDGKRVFSNTTKVDSIADGQWQLPWGQTISKEDKLVRYAFANDNCEYCYQISYSEISADEKISYVVYDYAMSVFTSKRVDGERQIHFCDMGYKTRGYYKANLVGNYYIKSEPDKIDNKI